MSSPEQARRARLRDGVAQARRRQRVLAAHVEVAALAPVAKPAIVIASTTRERVVLHAGRGP